MESMSQEEMLFTLGGQESSSKLAGVEDLVTGSNEDGFVSGMSLNGPA